MLVIKESFEIIGCSIYNFTDQMKLYAFWLTDKSNGTTNILFVDKTRYFGFTNFKEDDLKNYEEIAYKCISCENVKCTRHKLIKNTNHNFIFSFQDMKKSDGADFDLHSYPTLFFGCLSYMHKNNSETEKFPVVISNLSKTGIACKIIKCSDDNLFRINDEVSISVCARNFLNLEECIKCNENEKERMLKTLDGYIAWRINNYIGIEISGKSEEKISTSVDNFILNFFEQFQ